MPARPARALTQHGVEEFTRQAESCLLFCNMETEPQAGLPRALQRTVLSPAPLVTPLPLIHLPAAHKDTSVMKILHSVYSSALRSHGGKS